MSDAPKDAKKPAAKAEGKPAEAKPAAGKAPAKAAAKGAAKGAAKAKPVAEKKGQRTGDGPRKKSKVPLIPKPPNPEIQLVKQRREARKANRKADHENRLKKFARHAAYKKSAAEAKKKGLPAPKFPRRSHKEKKKLVREKALEKKKAQKAKVQERKRYILKLTPLNQFFQERFGFIFSEFIGKARGKALWSRNVKVAIHHNSHPLHGRIGRLVYYTGKHKAFVRVGHTLYKLPFGWLHRRKIYLEAQRKRDFERKQGHRLANYINQLRSHKKATEAAKKAGKPAPTAAKYLAAPFKKDEYAPLKTVARAPKKDKKTGAVIPAKKKPAKKDTSALPVAFFKNVGLPHKSRQGYYLQKAAEERRKRREEHKKAGTKAPATKRESHRRRRHQRGKPYTPKQQEARAAAKKKRAEAKAAKKAAAPASKPAAAKPAAAKTAAAQKA